MVIHQKMGATALNSKSFRSIFEQGPPPSAVPDSDAQFRYRAKMWFKGHAPDEREERQRTVQAINWFGRP